MSNSYPQSPVSLCSFSGAILILILLTTPVAVMAHAGHGDEFKAGSETSQASGSIM